MRIAVIATALWILVGCGRSAGAAVTDAPAVVVRVYQAAVAEPPDVSAALAVAHAALAAAAIDIVWQRCHAAAASCRTVPARSELSIRLVNGVSAAASRTQPLGEALIDTATGRGVLATVFLDRVAWLARLAGSDGNALLGRAIAHEIGHLLLGSTSHSRDGLMRPIWSPRDLRRAQPHDWMFSRADVVALHAARRGYLLEN